MTKWTDADNERRCDLIDKDIAQTITSGEFSELAELTDRFREHQAKVAPLPIKEATAALQAMQASVVEKERAAFDEWTPEQQLRENQRFCRWWSTCGVAPDHFEAVRLAWQASAALDRLPPMIELPEGATDPAPPA